VRVLVVDDEAEAAEALARLLRREGYVVDVAHDGVDGLHRAAEEAYDAVVLDASLPGLSGYSVVQRLRETGRWVPVLMMSAGGSEYDEAEALDLGADDYLTTPFSPVVLLARLRALVRRGAAPRPTQLQAGDLVLDPAAHRVQRGGVDVELTAREFALLHHLMRRKGEVVPKSELLDNVWDAAADIALNVVEVYVGYLRRKIDTPFGRRALVTVRGAGYSLDPDGG
jgi:two-component system, OmpR family, response regulator